MDVTKIKLVGLTTVELPLSVARPSDRFLIKAEDGLGPTGMNINIAGRTYQGRNALNRQLTFRLGLNPNYTLMETPAQLREELYRLLSPNTKDGSIGVEVWRGEEKLATTRGWVSKIEASRFAKEPEVQLVIDCVTPYLESPVLDTVLPIGSGVARVTNQGTAPTGFEFRIQFSAGLSSWAVTLGSAKMQFDYAFQQGDILYVNTASPGKKITLTRGATQLNIIDSLTRASDWLELHAGENLLTPTPAMNFGWGFVRYRPLFLGV